MNLIIIRHAKSSWNTNFMDHDRPLADRGIADAQLVFGELAHFLPSQYAVLSSTSKRTTQTAQLFSNIIHFPFEQINFKKELYTFDTNDFEAVIKENNVENLIVFGHNSAITDFVNKYGDYYIENVPTSGVVILKFVNKILLPKSAVIFKTIFPKDLK